jgi:hypothetical protein
MSPESGPRVPLGVVEAGVPPHAATRIATSAKIASNDLLLFNGIPPPGAMREIVLRELREP